MSTSRKLLIAAGPTHEPIDAVRFIANRSSGRMGIALVETALSRGLSTTLLLGPVAPGVVETPGSPPTPRSPEIPQPRWPSSDSHLVMERFQTTEDLREQLARLWPRHDVLFMAAAVADYRPVGPVDPSGKVRRRLKRWRLELEPTPDLLQELAATTRPDQTIIAFALEPDKGLLEAARQKLARKNVHAIVANPLETMGSEDVKATVLLRDGRTLTPPGATCSKREFARWLMDQLDEICAGKPSAISHQPSEPDE